MLFLDWSEICGARWAVSPNFSVSVETEVPLWYNSSYIDLMGWAGPFFCLLAETENGLYCAILTSFLLRLALFLVEKLERRAADGGGDGDH